MEKYGGKIMYRIRPSVESFIEAVEEKPYEIHIISFQSEEKLQAFMQDDARLQFLPLKEESVKSIFMVKGQKV